MSAEPPVAVTPPLATLDDWLAWLETLHPKKIDFTLDRIVEVLKALSLAEPPYRVVTVGGTNGKGSCVALLESIYGAAGYRVGAFTSPHLWRFNERVRLGGREADDATLVKLFEIIDAARGRVTLSYFEASLVAALLHFAREGVDVAVLEVGLGGRLDAVNALDADAVLIVSVDLDHMEWLGNDRDSIGWEKAGIMRAGRPAIIGDRDPPARLLARAAEVGARLEVIGRDFDHISDEASPATPAGPSGPAAVVAAPTRAAAATSIAPSRAAAVEARPSRPATATITSAIGGDWVPTGELPEAAFDEDPAADEAGTVSWCFSGGGDRRVLPLPPFGGGGVQLANAAACVALVRSLESVLPVDEEALATGLRAARLRGRLERRSIGGVEWVFDVGHNPAAARTLSSALDAMAPAGRTLAVFAAMRDKDIAGVLAPLVPRVDEWLVTQADMARGAQAPDIVATLERLGSAPAEMMMDVETACRHARARASAGDRVVVFGSFYMVGPALAAVGLYSAPTES